MLRIQAITNFFMWKMTFLIFITSRCLWHLRKMAFTIVSVCLSAVVVACKLFFYPQNVFLKIKNSIALPEWTRFGKMLRNEIVFFREISKFSPDYFFIGVISFNYYWKILFNIKTFGFQTNYKRYKKIWGQNCFF